VDQTSELAWSTSEVALVGGDQALIKAKAFCGPSAARRPIGFRFFRITTSPPPTVKTAIDDSTRLRLLESAVEQPQPCLPRLSPPTS
jgi:hypothetical protein